MATNRNAEPDKWLATLQIESGGKCESFMVFHRPSEYQENKDKPHFLVVIKDSEGHEHYVDLPTNPIPPPPEPVHVRIRLGLGDDSLILCEEESTDLNLKPFEDKLRALRHSIPEKSWKLEVITQYSNGLTDKRRIGE